MPPSGSAVPPHLRAVAAVDAEVCDVLVAEEQRQHRKVRLIPSENYVSRAVLEASASVMQNEYSEGYPGRRYYEGQQQTDRVEQICLERARRLFGADAANVQPYSGSPANLACYLAFAQPGDTVMGMALSAGGHLTHGHGVAVSGRWFKSVQYGVRREDHLIDYDEVARLAREHRPRLLFCGATAYPRVIDYGRLADIAKEVGAKLVADMAHIAGLVVSGDHPSPVPMADVVSTTTHKTLRGPRGGMLLMKAAHAKEIDKAVFPGLQGGPHMHTVAALAVALHEAAQPAFHEYGHQVVRNARALAEGLARAGFDLITGGTDNHLVLVDLGRRGVPGKVAARALDRAGLVVNYNSVPFDPRKPFDPSGMRLGSPAVTSRGMKEEEMGRIAGWIDRVLAAADDEALAVRVAGEVAELCAAFPAPGLEHLVR
jgi:glycine hydroxymethyltransferase